jgi:PAT family beta-lactamase induction signal transducer AmpG
MASNLGYAVVAEVGPNRPVMYAAQAFEYVTSGLGTGAFGVLLLRLTEKRFSATQYALLSSLFSIPRVLAGPPTGLIVDALGWRDFFILTVFAGIPGLLMLARFVPWGVREPTFHVATEQHGTPLSRRSLLLRTLAGGVVALVAGALATASLQSMSSLRAGKGFPVMAALRALATPTTVAGFTTVVGLLALAASVALGTAAALVARRGIARE